MQMRQPNDDFDYEDGDDLGVILQQPVSMMLPEGYVAIPEEKYEALVGAMQRMVILCERITSGEKLSKSMLLRALGMFEVATAESIYENIKEKK